MIMGEWISHYLEHEKSDASKVVTIVNEELKSLHETADEIYSALHKKGIFTSD